MDHLNKSEVCPECWGDNSLEKGGCLMCNPLPGEGYTSETQKRFNSMDQEVRSRDSYNQAIEDIAFLVKKLFEVFYQGWYKNDITWGRNKTIIGETIKRFGEEVVTAIERLKK